MPLSAPTHCEQCGSPIPKRRRVHGYPPKTCSVECRKARASARERARYERVNDTDGWKETRAAYIVKLKKRLEDDPEFASIFRAEAKARTREWQRRVRETDPARHAEMKAAARAERAAWRRKIEADPAAWEAHKAKCRAWYAGLSAEDRDRIFYRPRKLRA